MHRSFRLVLVSALSAALLVPFAGAADSGHVDFGSLPRGQHGRVVDVNIGGGLLKLASFFVRAEEPRAAKIMARLSRVRVQVIELDDGNRAAMTSHLEAIRERLAGEGWQRIVTVRGGGDDDVAVHVKQRDSESVDGLVVTVIDRQRREAVLVNVVGRIHADQLAELGEHLQIGALARTRKADRG